jgi:hypothetical protein
MNRRSDAGTDLRVDWLIQPIRQIMGAEGQEMQPSRGAALTPAWEEYVGYRTDHVRPARLLSAEYASALWDWMHPSALGGELRVPRSK